MLATIKKSTFIQFFTDMGQGHRFSYEGRQAIFAHLEKVEKETGEPIELDIIALCKFYTEFKNISDFQ